MTEKTKKLLHSYGFFTSILLVMFTILILVVFFSRNAGHKTVINMLQSKLETKYEDQYQVKEAINISLPLSVSSFVFAVDDTYTKSDEDNMAIVAIRMTGSYGPFVGVYFQTEKGVEFLGTIGLPEDEHEFSWNSISKNQIDYWAKNISNFLKDYATESEM